MHSGQQRKRLPPAPDEAMLRAALHRTAEREKAGSDRERAPVAAEGPACALMPGIPRGTPLCASPPRDIPVVLCWDDC